MAELDGQDSGQTVHPVNGHVAGNVRAVRAGLKGKGVQKSMKLEDRGEVRLTTINPNPPQPFDGGRTWVG